MRYFLALLALFMLPSFAMAQQAVQVVGAQSFTTGQVTAASATVPQLILPARPYRQRTIVLQVGANQCSFGNSAVTASTGYAPAPVAGGSFMYDNASALYAVCAASTVITFIEGF